VRPTGATPTRLSGRPGAIRQQAAHLGPVEQSARYADLIAAFASRINLSPSAPQPPVAVKASLR